MLEVNKLSREGSGVPVVSDRRLLLASDNNTVVEDGDQRGAFLLCGAGGEIPAVEAARLGLNVVDGRVVQGGAEKAPKKPVEAPAKTEKMAPAPEDKMIRGPKENKGASGKKG